MSSESPSVGRCLECGARVAASRPVREPNVETYEGTHRGGHYATDYYCARGHTWREPFPPPTPKPDAHVF